MSLRFRLASRPSPRMFLERPDIQPVPCSQAGKGRRIIVIGAGPAGLLAAILLRRRGYTVAVHERRRDFRALDPHSLHQAVGVGLMYRGIKHLQRGGLSYEEIRACGVPATAYEVTGHGRTLVLPMSDGHEVLALDRKALIELLLAKAQAHGVDIYFGHELHEIDVQATRAVFATEHGTVVDAGEAIIGADGAFSATRHLLQRRAPRFSCSQRYYDRGWKTITLPRASEHGFCSDRIYFYGGEALVHGSFKPGDVMVFTICLRHEGPGSLHMTDADEIRGFFARNLPRLAACHPDLVAEFCANPARDFVTVACSRFHHRRVLLLGDSAHAMVPFLGQGMNCALEDAGVLHDLVAELADDWDQIPPAFTRVRKPHADAITELSLEHYHILDASRPWHLARIGYLAAMHRRFPRLFSMDMSTVLSLTDIPYTEVQQMQERQNRWYRLGRM